MSHKVAKKDFRFRMNWAKHSPSSGICSYLICKYLILSSSQGQEAKLWTNQGTFLLGKQVTAAENKIVECLLLFTVQFKILDLILNIFSMFLFFLSSRQRTSVNSVFGKLCSLHFFEALLKFAQCYSEVFFPLELFC